MTNTLINSTLQFAFTLTLGVPWVTTLFFEIN